MSKLINLNCPTLSVIEIINNSDISDIISFIEDKDGDITFLSSCKDINLLYLAKLEIEKELLSLTNQNYPDLDSDYTEPD